MVLTQGDLDAIKNLIEVAIDEAFDGRLGLEPTQTLDEKLGYLPTKEEFYSKMDEIMKELRDIREELAATTHRTSDNTDRIEKLEKIHPDDKHASAI